MKGPLHTATNENTGMKAEVFLIGTEAYDAVYRVRLMDTDAGEVLQSWKDFPTEQAAINYANKCIQEHDFDPPRI